MSRPRRLTDIPKNYKAKIKKTLKLRKQVEEKKTFLAIMMQELVYNMAANGVSKVQIAEVLEISRQSVYKILEKRQEKAKTR